MPMRNIDSPGKKRDRDGVRTIMRLQGSAARKARAQAKRDRRRAKRVQASNDESSAD